jgi:hypothetical protein
MSRPPHRARHGCRARRSRDARHPIRTVLAPPSSRLGNPHFPAGKPQLRSSNPRRSRSGRKFRHCGSEPPRADGFSPARRQDPSPAQTPAPNDGNCTSGGIRGRGARRWTRPGANSAIAAVSHRALTDSAPPGGKIRHQRKGRRPMTEIARRAGFRGGARGAGRASLEPTDAGAGRASLDPTDAGARRASLEPTDAGAEGESLDPTDAGAGRESLDPTDAGAGRESLDPDRCGGGARVVGPDRRRSAGPDRTGSQGPMDAARQRGPKIS